MNIALNLEKKCSRCDWCEYFSASRMARVPCVYCKGTGKELTEEGEELLEFLKRHWKPRRRETTGGPG